MRRPLTYALLLYILYILVSYYVFDYSPSLQPQSSIMEQKAIDNETVEMMGVVLDKSITRTGNDKLIVKAVSMDDKKIEENIKLQIYLDCETDVGIDDEVIIVGELMNFDFARNPGAFNEELYMRTKKIDYKMFGMLKEKSKGRVSLNGILKKLNSRLSDVYDNALPEKEASIVKAMVLGDKTELDGSIKELYRKAGISHILAISGLHISMLAMMILNVFTKLLNRRVASIITMLFLILYTLLIGASVSAIRATLMMFMYLIGNIIFKRSESITSISVAAFILLLVQPLFLWDIAFQLSFTAVLGLVLFAPSYEANTIFLKAKKLFETTLAAVTATAPVVMYHFYEVSVIALIVNTLILPFVSFVLGLSVLVGIVGLFSGDAAYLLSGSVYFVLKFYEMVSTLAIKIPFSNIETGSPDIVIILLCYIALAAIYIQKNKIFRHAEVMMYASVGILIIAVLISIITPQQFQVVFLDVGQGDSCVIHTANNKNIMIDAGGKLMSPLGDNTGVNIVYPYLKRKAIKKLDCVIVTHPDADHMLGVIELISLVSIEKLIIPDVNFTGNELNDMLLAEADKYKVAIVKIKANDKIQVDKDLWLECIYPYKTDSHVKNTNNYSAVFKMHYKDKKILFTGDIEKEAEYDLVQNADLKTDILKVAHHGSKTSSTMEFLQEAAPEYAIISCKKDNSFGHPSQEVLENLSRVISSYNKHNKI